jgi:hypothetical protein
MAGTPTPLPPRPGVIQVTTINPSLPTCPGTAGVNRSSDRHVNPVNPVQEATAMRTHAEMSTLEAKASLGALLAVGEYREASFLYASEVGQGSLCLSASVRPCAWWDMLHE